MNELEVLEREFYEPYSWIAGCLALVVAFLGLDVFYPDRILDPGNLGVLIGVLLGFTLHELSHRSIARWHGVRAEFVAYTPGLLITIASALLPFKVLAPGYVKVWGYTSQKSYALTVAGGPLANITLALFCILILRLGGRLLDPTHSLIINDVIDVNIWIAFFNLLPVPPLDGYKLFSIDKRVWLALLAFLIVLLFVR